ILEPELPIIDTHHHLWVRPDHRYLLDELLADLRTGHNVIATVFVECHAMYRARGPVELRPIGETEFVAGIAAMSDSGLYGPTRVAPGSVGLPSPARRCRRPRSRVSEGEHHRGPRGWSARLRSVCGQAGRGVRRVEGRDHRARPVPERGHEARRHDDAPGRLRLRCAARAALLGRAGGLLAAVCRDVHRTLRCGP